MSDKMLDDLEKDPRGQVSCRCQPMVGDDRQK